MELDGRLQATATHHSLFVYPADGEQHQLFLISALNIIGRDDSCEVVVRDRFVSRRHARIELSETGAKLLDEGSRNGLSVNGRIVPPEVGIDLKSGDRVDLGQSHFVYQQLDGSETVPAGTEISEPRKRIVVSVNSREVFIDGVQLPHQLSRLEFNLLALLWESAGKVCTRNALGAELWGTGNYTYDMLHQLVHRMKRKLELPASDDSLLVSVPGVGYMLRV